MASFNPFGALDSDDEGESSVAVETSKNASSSAGSKAIKASKSSVSASGQGGHKSEARGDRPRRDGEGRGGRTGGRSGGRGEFRGGRGGGRGYGGGRYDGGAGGERNGFERESFDDRRREPRYGDRHGGDRGGRAGYAGRDGRNREYDRRSGTGRGREVKKNGAGSRNWGSHDAHDVDGAGATADGAEAEGGWGAGASNGNANESTEGTGWDVKDPEPPNIEESGVEATAAGGGDDAAAEETQAEEAVAEAPPEPEPEEIQMTLEEHEAMRAEKARELAEMVGKVSIKTVDTSDFDEGAIRVKSEVEAEGFLGSKVSKTRKVKTQQRQKEIFQNVGFRAPPSNSGGRGRGRGRGYDREGRGRGGRSYDRPQRPQYSGDRSNGYGGEGGDGDYGNNWRGGGRNSHDREDGEVGAPNEDGGPPRPRFQGGGRGRYDRDSGYQGGGYRGNGDAPTPAGAPLNLKDDEAFPSL